MEKTNSPLYTLIKHSQKGPIEMSQKGAGVTGSLL